MTDQYQAGRKSAIEDLFKLLEVDGSEFYYNKPNNYGCITFQWFCGEGDPWDQYRGEESKGQYIDGVRGTGRYRLNSAAVELMVSTLNSKPT